VIRISKRPEPVHNCSLSLVHLARTIELQSVTPSYSKKHLEGQPRVRGRTQNTDSGRVAHLEGKRWSHGATTERQGRDGAIAAGLRLRKNHSGEHGPDEPERGRANRRVSRAADGEAELTMARDGAQTRW
jgi:hypothetical protein